MKCTRKKWLFRSNYDGERIEIGMDICYNNNNVRYIS